jgi:hypothetical protein
VFPEGYVQQHWRSRVNRNFLLDLENGTIVHPYKPDFSVSCAEMAEWKMLSEGFDKFMLCSTCSAAVQIKLKNGKKKWWYIGTAGDEGPARAVVSAISKACDVNP